MTQETLERLIIDRAMGELSPDASALLDHWLAANPDAAVTASKLEGTLAGAASVLRRGAPAGDPPAADRVFEAISNGHSRRAAWVWPARLALAACVGVAFWAGMQVNSARQAQTGDHGTPPAHLRHLAAADRNSPPQSEGGFWSFSNWQSHPRTAPAAARDANLWSGPLRPRNGGAS